MREHLKKEPHVLFWFYNKKYWIMSGTTSDSDAETVITEGTTDGGKANKEKGKVSQTAAEMRWRAAFL